MDRPHFAIATVAGLRCQFGLGLLNGPNIVTVLIALAVIFAVKRLGRGKDHKNRAGFAANAAS
ncbi:MAG: hypothetical protein A2201_00615 [Alicyclobacillus sp. RIFOXYA1_FULL_53_8]|nr:MAG: hypothetical protein A2201_00615 [Alicyclobacillus sp. RIFOXYA1_FULL_53_8]